MTSSKIHGVSGMEQGAPRSSRGVPWLPSQRPLQAEGNIEPKEFEHSRRDSSFITKERLEKTQVKFSSIVQENSL